MKTLNMNIPKTVEENLVNLTDTQDITLPIDVKCVGYTTLDWIKNYEWLQSTRRIL